ncbi:hypothetical protein H7R39_07360 [Campylobacter sp. Marseille-Q3452]|uniref:Uncharacterized protein n=1 Tax=Campylobacter massiliensis TaxID=2762557 RepID=A0A842J8G7_9BACT|nr:hypothetical protein [Campylobacter massiliensis]MBC2883070.1 hypothetical protein [Campylobacter massiliensis]
MRVILDGFDGSFLPILQSFKAVMPSLRITGIEELGQSVKEEAPGGENGDNADAINVSELFARRDERDELLSDGTLFLQDDKFNESGEATAVKFDENVKFENARQAIDDAKFETNLMPKSEQKIAYVQEQNLQEMHNATPYRDGSREKEAILQTGSLSEAPKTAVLVESTQTTAVQEASIFGGATQTASFGKTATSNQAAKTAVSDDSAQAALFDFNESGQNLTPRAEPKAALERKKHESASLFTDEEVRAILELK